MKFGGKDQYVASTSVAYRDILKINSDDGLTLYVLYYGYKYSSCMIIGRQKNGIWFKYIDTDNIEKTYYPNAHGYWDKPHYLSSITCQGNTIILPCDWLGKENIKGEFRFKWDEQAQWFGVEQVVY